ncbi:unnamed protein product [Microthlaspi erraticum]|uniref:Uncharacterized protein n=1 Tax=Microthlaspi erraticum TaxID=1685480 RepID=A0A6D2K753_9BRAS|nr:unnamed protein product [Microthlaspi erraticum]
MVMDATTGDAPTMVVKMVMIGGLRRWLWHSTDTSLFFSTFFLSRSLLPSLSFSLNFPSGFLSLSPHDSSPSSSLTFLLFLRSLLSLGGSSCHE